MKTIKFNGIMEGRRGGCSSCGKSTSNGRLTTTKMFMLPSGAHVTFRAGHSQEVTDEDAAFLLSYSYIDKKGNRRQAFEEE